MSSRGAGHARTRHPLGGNATPTSSRWGATGRRRHRLRCLRVRGSCLCELNLSAPRLWVSPPPRSGEAPSSEGLPRAASSARSPVSVSFGYGGLGFERGSCRSSLPFVCS